jgi:hypothetical protein
LVAPRKPYRAVRSHAARRIATFCEIFPHARSVDAGA